MSEEGSNLQNDHGTTLGVWLFSVVCKIAMGVGYTLGSIAAVGSEICGIIGLVLSQTVISAMLEGSQGEIIALGTAWVLLLLYCVRVRHLKQQRDFEHRRANLWRSNFAVTILSVFRSNVMHVYPDADCGVSFEEAAHLLTLRAELDGHIHVQKHCLDEPLSIYDCSETAVKALAESRGEYFDGF